MSKTIHVTGLKQKILELQAEEQDFLDGCRGVIFELLEEAGVESSDDGDLLAECDELVRAWHRSDPETRTDANQIVTSCGIILGDHLALAHQLDWAVCEDKDGVELCLFRKENEVLLFPTHSVAKRFGSGAEGFLSELHDQLSASLANMK